MYSYSSFFLHRITRSYRKHSCSTDYARNLNGFGLAAIGLAPYRLAYNCPIMAGFFNCRGYRYDRQVEFPFRFRA